MMIKREWATPLTAGAFLLLAVTGLLMFFHADSGLNKVAHEWLSWALIAGVTVHVTANFKAFQNHLKARRGQLLIGLFALILAGSFLSLGGKDEPPFVAPIQALAHAPVSALAPVAQVPPEEFQARLQKAGLSTMSERQTIAEWVAGREQQMRILGQLLAPSPTPEKP